MKSNLAGKVALVTGANGGLGSHVTLALLEEGATVVGLSPKIRQSDFDSPAFIAWPAEISSGETAKTAVDGVIAKFGKVDILAHLAGGFAGGKSVAETDDATFQRMFDVNLNSAFYLFRGSRAAEDPGPGVGAYGASKAALVSLVRTIAAENKDDGLTANVLLPGTMDTAANRRDMPKSDFSTWVQPDAVASLITWLAAHGGRNVNGAVIRVYGRGL